MPTLGKAFLIAAAVLCLTLGLVVMAPVILVGVVDDAFKAAQ